MSTQPIFFNDQVSDALCRGAIYGGLCTLIRAEHSLRYGLAVAISTLAINTLILKTATSEEDLPHQFPLRLFHTLTTVKVVGYLTSTGWTHLITAYTIFPFLTSCWKSIRQETSSTL